MIAFALPVKFRYSVIVLISLILAWAPLRAQDAPRTSDDLSCLRFQFGTWTPALNWKGAGHITTLDTSKVDRAPDGRAWAAASAKAAGDSTLILYPTFWPAGVTLSFDARKLAAGDTALAKATAMVADAKVAPSIAKAKVWRVNCHS